MDLPEALPAAHLCRACDAESFAFAHTGEVAILDEVIGQPRAVEAVRFGIGIERSGYNIFAHGRSGTGKQTTIRHFLQREARERPAPDDWCYVHNFETPHRPRALRLPAGQGGVLAAALDRAVEALLVGLPAAFEGEAYTARRSAVVAQFQGRSRANFEALERAAEARGIAVIQSEEGLSFAPRSGEGVMSPEAFEALPEAEQASLRGQLDAVQAALGDAAAAEQQVQREAGEALAALEREAAAALVEQQLAELRAQFAALPPVLAYLDAVARDMLDRLPVFLGRIEPAEEGEAAAPKANADVLAAARERRRSDLRLRRYRVNVLVDHDPAAGAPLISEPYPSLANLVGRIEHEQRLGALETDFNLIKAGALHRANGGFLVIYAEDILSQPHSWEALKRALRHEEIRIEAPASEQSPMSTITLEPEPIPLRCKAILLGETGLYFSLYELDSDLKELFKVGAEFAATMPREPETQQLYARLVATVVQREGLLPVDRAAVARVVEHGARQAGDAERLSTDFLDVTDLLREADYLAQRAGRAMIDRGAVEEAIRLRDYRSDLARERLQEAHARALREIAVEGSAVGQVNGLSVLTRGNFSFGIPMRISATVRLGAGEVVDIAREVDLGGPIHSKGVLTLSGFLAGRYMIDDDLAFAASLTFEQAYEPVDGDSASSAELFALLSALGGLPMRQSLAVTGALNQAGAVQAIGGVNEKIEGFFDLCRQRGLSGDQGVIIPAANAQQLMLRRDLVAAAEAGRFRVYAIATVDEGMALLTGLPAGARGEDGSFPPGSVNRRVEDRLRRLAEQRQRRAGQLPAD